MSKLMDLIYNAYDSINALLYEALTLILKLIIDTYLLFDNIIYYFKLSLLQIDTALLFFIDLLRDFINRQTPAFPWIIIDALGFLNNFFPLNDFFNLFVWFFYYLFAAVSLKLVLRLVSFGKLA